MMDQAHGHDDLTPDDERLIWSLYNRAVLAVYGPWSVARGATWLPSGEAARAEYAANVARLNLAKLAEWEDRQSHGRP